MNDGEADPKGLADENAGIETADISTLQHDGMSSLPTVPEVSRPEIPWYLGGLCEEKRHILDDLGKRISGCLETITRSTFEIGRMAVEAKEILGHGNFAPWVDEKFSCSIETIERCMNAWRIFGDDKERVASLGKTELCDLAAPCVPESFRQRILSDLDDGRVFKRGEMTREIKAAREQSEQANSGKSSPKARARTGLRSKIGLSRESAPSEIESDIDYGDAEIRNDTLADFIIGKIGEDGEEFLQLYQSTDADRVLEIVAGKFQIEQE